MDICIVILKWCFLIWVGNESVKWSVAVLQKYNNVKFVSNVVAFVGGVAVILALLALVGIVNL